MFVGEHHANDRLGTPLFATSIELATRLFPVHYENVFTLPYLFPCSCCMTSVKQVVNLLF